MTEQLNYLIQPKIFRVQIGNQDPREEMGPKVTQKEPGVLTSMPALSFSPHCLTQRGENEIHKPSKLAQAPPSSQGLPPSTAGRTLRLT